MSKKLNAAEGVRLGMEIQRMLQGKNLEVVRAVHDCIHLIEQERVEAKDKGKAAEKVDGDATS